MGAAEPAKRSRLRLWLAVAVLAHLIAAGVLASARGMATEALLEAYDWNNDAAEMADAAASGLSLSNHSYGSPAGWVDNLKGDGFWGWLGDPSIDPQEDYRFGYYDAVARTWDEIAAAAPTYLIVKSAGNERADRGPNPGAPHYVFESKWILSTTVRSVDGGATGFDTILDGGVSKNVLTVGAVEDLPWGYSAPDDVVMTDFSGWGPTDDGRIKPDLVANGVQLMSSMAWAADGYGTSSGSSMAAPGVTGTAGLLGVLYKTTH
ncbi:MAG: S8 family serine peptidase, partial [Chloroflexi bacterium]|nr:S8 family serine peptidase [Chloroflexota bacterium]